MNAILEVEYFYFNTKKNIDERSHVKVSPKYYKMIIEDSKSILLNVCWELCTVTLHDCIQTEENALLF